MTRRLLILLAVFAVVSTGALVYFFFHYGDLRPALLPPTQDITKIVEQNEQRQESAMVGVRDAGASMVPLPVGDTVEFPLKLPDGFRIGIFAKQLGNARDLQFSPEGTLLVSSINSGTVYALPDKNNDGKADENKALLTGLGRPHGIGFFRSFLYVAEEKQLVRYLWDESTVTATKDRVLFSLPSGGRHFTRSIAFNKKGEMFVTIGSTCDVCFEKHEFIATTLVSDWDGKTPRVYSKGLRNAPFVTVHPATDEVWVTEMGRDMLGDNLPPDEINILRDNGNYGWPLCYGGNVADTHFDSKSTDSTCTAMVPPVYQIPAHSAPLGLTFIASPQFPSEWQGDLLVSYHGSWNRSVPTGYKVVRLDVAENTVIKEEDFLSGFLQGSTALGRPVDVTFDAAGSLYISDDKAGVVYKISR